MQEELRSRWLRPALVGVIVIALDQASKAWILRTLGPNEGTSIPLVGSWLSLTFVKNNGVAFGMFQGIPYFFTTYVYALFKKRKDIFYQGIPLATRQEKITNDCYFE